MDKYEATKVVMTRIQSLDPENASKIMGYILIQDKGEKEMIRLAFLPEPLLLSCIDKAKACLGISSSNPFPLNTPRILIPNNGFRNFSNPSSPAAAAFQVTSPRPFTYAAALNGSTAAAGGENGSGSPGVHFYGGDEFGSEFSGGCRQVQDRLSFFDDPMSDPVMSPGGMSDSLVFPYGEDANGVPSPHPFHRRSCSVNDAAFLSNILEDNDNGGGFGWRPCMYFARGFCKNGSSCKFLHVDIAAGGGGGGGGEGIEVGSPGYNNSGFDELLRMKALQQQRFAAMAAAGGGGGGGHHPFAYNKCMDFLNENPRSALMMGGESHKFNRFRPDRNDFSMMANSIARQIYLTFPADSSFKEDDVSNYFSIFGPVQDVRIPYQQKRMFGFVTFVFSETVKLILAKGNPHFVCDSRVLVKPYKEKGKVPDKKQHLERGEFSSCLSPSAIDSREHIDLPFGSRMLFSPQEIMLRRKLEQEAELQHAIEIQSRRMMNLQLMELKQNHHHNNILLPSFISSPRQSQLPMNQNQNFTNASGSFNQEDSEAKFDGSEEAVKSPVFGADEKLVLEKIESFTSNKQHCHVNGDGSNFSESFEDMLPDNLFASPTKVAAENNSVFSEASSSTDDGTTTPLTISNNNMASLKSCYIQMPRFSSGQEAIEM